MKIEYRFDIAAILLASVLTVLGISAAEAGGTPDAEISGGSGASAAQFGGKGGASGGDVRTRKEGGLARGFAERGTAVAVVCYPPPFPGAGDWWCRQR